MNYLYLLSFVIVVSVAFGRISKNHSSSDASFTFSARQFGIGDAQAASDDENTKWKRRHKKRKKSRRPQRGR